MFGTLGMALLAVTQSHPIAEIDTIVNAGIELGAYPGAVAVVGTADSVLLARGYGRLEWRAGSPTPSIDSTLYDLASLTKVVATTPSIMVLVNEGRLRLDDPVQQHVPDFVGEGKDAITVRDLLTHTTGLRAFLPLNTLAESAAEARALVVAEPLRWSPGSRVEYSDLNAMLAGWVVEGVTGRTLDQYARDAVFQPLGMSSTRFKLPRALHDRAAPINRWRGHPIRGVVHDQNAARLDSVSGHAGLYSTAADLARYAQFYLRWGAGPNGTSLVDSVFVAEFVTRRAGSRALGWETKDTSSSDNAGTAFSARSFGHGGYTGTSLWIDPEAGVFVILLTNRVFAPRTRQSITHLKRIRGRLADASIRLHEHTCRILVAAGRVDGAC